MADEINCQSTVVDEKQQTPGEIDCQSTVVDEKQQTPGEIDCQNIVVDEKQQTPGEIDCQNTVVDEKQQTPGEIAVMQEENDDEWHQCSDAEIEILKRLDALENEVTNLREICTNLETELQKQKDEPHDEKESKAVEDELKSTEEKLRITEDTLTCIHEELDVTKQELYQTRQELDATKQELDRTGQELNDVNARWQEHEAEVQQYYTTMCSERLITNFGWVVNIMNYLDRITYDCDYEMFKEKFDGFKTLFETLFKQNTTFTQRNPVGMQYDAQSMVSVDTVETDNYDNFGKIASAEDDGYYTIDGVVIKKQRVKVYLFQTDSANDKN